RMSFDRSDQSCWQTAPAPSVVRSSVASWITTSRPSREGWTSNSTCSTGSLAVCSKARRLFSAHNKAPPRCEAISVIVKKLRSGSSQGRIEAIAQPVADDADRQRRQDDDRAGEQQNPRGARQVLAAIAHHVAQRTERRLHA